MAEVDIFKPDHLLCKVPVFITFIPLSIICVAIFFVRRRFNPVRWRSKVLLCVYLFGVTSDLFGATYRRCVDNSCLLAISISVMFNTVKYIFPILWVRRIRLFFLLSKVLNLRNLQNLYHSHARTRPRQMAEVRRRLPRSSGKYPCLSISAW